MFNPSATTILLTGIDYFRSQLNKNKTEYANTVAQFTDEIADGNAPELFGDGSQTRDFTHVSDVARACELAADNELTSAYNIGTEEASSFNEMVAMINNALGTGIEPEYIECPFDGDVHDTMADASAFRDATNWEPQIGFEEGVELVCESYLSEDTNSERVRLSESDD